MESKNKAVYTKRKNTLKKKAQELSTLCDIPVCLVSDDTDDHVDTWPENHDAVSRILLKFYKDSEDMSRKIFETNMSAYPSWDPEVDYCSDKSVDCIIKYVNDKIKKIEEKELAGSSHQDDEEAEAKEVAECSNQGGDDVDSDQEEEEDVDDDAEQPKDDEVDTDRKEDGLDSATTISLEGCNFVPDNSGTSTNNNHENGQYEFFLLKQPGQRIVTEWKEFMVHAFMWRRNDDFFKSDTNFGSHIPDDEKQGWRLVGGG